MNNSRRSFFKKAALASAGSAFLGETVQAVTDSEIERYAELDEVLSKPVLKKSLFSEPVIIESLELLRFEDNFLCRVRSKDGAVGISVGNNMQMVSLYPIFTRRLQPFFPGKDARNLEQLLDEVYVYQSNYKLQNLALWVPLATIEFAILDMLGKIAGKPMGELIGEIHHTEIAVYQANNFRGKSAEESIAGIKKQVEETQAKALKFKVGGRMSAPEIPLGRSEKLIPLVRKTFGDDMTIYADSNGSYDVKEAIRIGKIMEEYKIDFYEEPVPFDWYEETKMVTDAVNVPVAGGEQEPSLHNFRWLIGNDALQIVQPDIFYFGGMIRSMKVARMAAVKNMECTPHISGSGLGYLYMMHFVSAVPNAGPYHEFKGFNNEIPLTCSTSDLVSHGGVVKVPSGPGMGVELDAGFVRKHKVVI
ncbi:mandelate racemase/muconate lactonizing enzyme family protein [Mariniphaga sp.]|uniref:mandelate racemase/muconate lactonizing enzyme family protein n=1 Tax=Mariniphaga sp. TaxID=1954475 RepID=UPI00356A0E2D